MAVHVRMAHVIKNRNKNASQSMMAGMFYALF